MQQYKQHTQARRLVTGAAAAVALIALVALFAALALAGTGSSVDAAPRSGGPTLAVTDISGNAVTIAGDGWVSGETITLSYSTNTLCTSPAPLAATPNTFSLESSNFQVTITWPSNMRGGTYYLCASGSVSGGPFAAPQPIVVNNNGGVQSTPNSTTTARTTTTGASATATPGGHPGSTVTTDGTTGNGNNTSPGSKGASSSTSVSSLVAIILLCVLVLALLVYLIRIWLQGRQAGGPTP